MKYIGIDFGTSNSLASVVSNGAIEFVRYPDGRPSNPTMLYFPNKSKQYSIGAEGIARYLADLEAHESAGRLMLSIKSLLPEASFDYTTVAGFGRQTAADLAARYLAVLKSYAEKQFAEKYDGVILGRPVNFPELAVERLRAAAEQAGFREIVFWLEPVAAALAYELTSAREELVCVVDLGGGTSDICVVAASPARSASSERAGDIKAVSGVSQAGDELNSRLMRERLGERFGAGSTFHSLGKTLPFPVHLIEKIARWHRINLLKNSRDIGDIIDILRSSDRPDDVGRLLNLIKHHYGFELFQAIDRAKRELSEETSARIKFRPLELDEQIALAEFEELAGAVAEQIEAAILACLEAAAVTPDRIDRVILTGGTAQIPLLSRLAASIFGEAKIVRPDYFGAVATGLGHVAGQFSRS